MLETSLPVTRLGPADRPVVHAYYDVCPESPDGSRAIVTVFSGDAIPGPARVAIVDRTSGEVLRTIGEPVEAIGHVGRFALWLDEDRIALRQGEDEAVGGWSIVTLSTGEQVDHPGALRQWHAGTGRGLVQQLGTTPNPHRLRQGIAVVDDQGRTVAEAGVPDCLACLPEGETPPPIDMLDVKNFKWAPDGSRFFVVFNTEQYGNFIDRDGPRFKTIVSFNAEAGDARFLGHFGHHPTWSGDGSLIYAMDVRDDGSQDLVALPADGSLETQTVLESIPGAHGSPTPDGRRWIIDVPEADHSECAIAAFDLATGRREDLVRFSHTRWDHRTGNHPHPVVTPDGRRVYFNAQADGRCGCYMIELAG